MQDQTVGAMHRQGRSGRNTEHLGPESGAQQPPEQEGGACQQQHRQGEATRHPVGEALDRGLAGLSLLHQMDDAGDGALGAAATHLQLQRRRQVEAAGGQLLTRHGRLGHRLAGERREIQCRLAGNHHTVDRDAVARKHLDAIAGPQTADPDLPRRTVVHQQQSLIGLQLDQLLDRPARAPAGPLLQEAAGQHEAQQHHRLVEEAGPTAGGPQQPDRAREPGAGHAQPHERVHAGQAGQGGAEAVQQDRAAGKGQGQGGHQAVQPGAGQGRERRPIGEGAALCRMAQGRDQHQAEGHEESAPLLPPVALPQPLTPAEGGGVLLARTGLEAQLGQAGEERCQPLGRLPFGIRPRAGLVGPPQAGLQFQPGGAGQEIDAGLAYPRLLHQALLDSPHAAAALHPLHLQQQRAGDLVGRPLRGLGCCRFGPQRAATTGSPRGADGPGRTVRPESEGAGRQRPRAREPQARESGPLLPGAVSGCAQAAGWDDDPPPSPCPARSATTTSSTRASR